MFKSKTTHPPGGWQIYEPQYDWPPDKRVLRGLGLEAVIDKVVEKRKANPRFGLSLDRGQIEREILIYTEKLVRGMKGTESYLVDGEPPPPNSSFPLARSLRRAVEAAGTVKRLAAGVGLLVDWLGDGLEAVPIPIAEARARVCATSGKDKDGNPTLCPFNRPAQGLQVLSGKAAEEIHQLMESKAQMKLQTPHDAALETCQLCSCFLKLKVWTPRSHLLSKTPQATIDRFQSDWPPCWMNRED